MSIVVIQISRGIAFFLGSFTLLNIIGDSLCPGFDSNIWWIDLRPINDMAAKIILGLSAFFLLMAAFWFSMSKKRRTVTVFLLGILMAAVVRDVCNFYWLAFNGTLYAIPPVPFSLFVAISISLVFISIFIENPIHRRQKRKFGKIVPAVVFLFCIAGFALGQMLCFGKTDYRRKADAIVIFGARVYKDGRLSNALADRMRTGCILYNEGYARQMVLSGGPGDGSIHETAAMRDMAISLGVPKEAIILDEIGLNTLATVKNIRSIYPPDANIRILAVSHFYHLPRIKMSFNREGVEVYTIPAKESYVLTKLPLFMTREIAAMLTYYIRPLYCFSPSQLWP